MRRAALYPPEPAALDDSGVPAISGSFVPDESPDISLRLGSNDREAVKLECFYALNPSHNGTSGKKINGWTVSDWNYLASDLNAWSAVRDCYGSAWCGLDGNATYCGCSHGGYSWHMIKGSKSFYRYPSAYGYQDGYGRGGQCRYFGNLILYRSGTGKRLPTYTAVINDYNSSPRRYTKLGGEARVEISCRPSGRMGIPRWWSRSSRVGRASGRRSWTSWMPTSSAVTVPRSSDVTSSMSTPAERATSTTTSPSTSTSRGTDEVICGLSVFERGWRGRQLHQAMPKSFLKFLRC